MSLRNCKSSLFILLFCLLCSIDAADELEVSGNGLIDFGIYSATESRTHTFQLTNRTDSIVILKKVRSTCACLTEEVNNKQLLPGASFEFSATIQAYSVSGTFSKVLYVETNLANRRFIRLELKGEARPLIQVTPGTLLYVGKLVAGKQYEFRFELTPELPNVSVSSAKDSGGILKKTDHGWIFICQVTPQMEEMIVERIFQIDIDTPTSAPPVKIQIRGTLERNAK